MGGGFGISKGMGYAILTVWKKITRTARIPTSQVRKRRSSPSTRRLRRSSQSTSSPRRLLRNRNRKLRNPNTVRSTGSSPPSRSSLGSLRITSSHRTSSSTISSHPRNRSPRPVGTVSTVSPSRISPGMHSIPSRHRRNTPMVKATPKPPNIKRDTSTHLRSSSTSSLQRRQLTRRPE